VSALAEFEVAAVPDAPEFGLAGRWLFAACRAAAVAGTLVFVALVAMSIVSIGGRKVASMPVPGDVELLQLCAAFASSSFFAWCHLNQGDVKVDFFTEHLSARYVHALDALASLMVAAVGALLAWRTGVGVVDAFAVGETTMILGLPLWPGPALMVPGFLLLSLAGLYRSALHLRRLRQGTRR
jgi:TRAP-type mannitol/chloroaromatic compound transport system permease small subunit